MKVYYIMMHGTTGSFPMFHLGLFTWPSAAQDYIDIKLSNPSNIAMGRTYTIEETFINEPED